MAFVDKSNSKKIYAYLTQQGREKILTGDTKDFIVTDFSLHDNDVNYFISANKVNSEYNLLPSGFIPDVTGDNQDCTISVVDQLLNNELFGSIPPPRIGITGCGISTATNYNPNLNTSNGDVIDNTLCIFPPPQPLSLVDVVGQCETEPYKFKISVNNIDGGTQPYKWYVTTNYADNTLQPFSTIRNEGDFFIFDTPTQGNAIYTVKVSDSSTPPLTAEKTFSNVSCQPAGPYVAVRGSCSSDWVYNGTITQGVNLANRHRPAWRYKITIEKAQPAKDWSYIIVSKALSPTSTNINAPALDFANLDYTFWDTYKTTRPNAIVFRGPNFPSNNYGFDERRIEFDNTNNPFRTEIIELPGNVGRPIDYQIIFYDNTLAYGAAQKANRITAFTVTNISCEPKRKIRLKVIKVTKPTYLIRDGNGIANYDTPNAYVEFDVKFGTTSLDTAFSLWTEFFDGNAAYGYLDPDIAPTRIMRFERYSQDHGFFYETNVPPWYINQNNQYAQSSEFRLGIPNNVYPLEIAIPFYIAYDELGGDYADIYLFNKTNIPSDFKVQFRTVGSFNKQNIKFPQIGNPKIDWTEDASGRMVSPEYNLTDSFIEQKWTYNGREQAPIFRRFDYDTGQPGARDDGQNVYYINYPGSRDGCEGGVISNPGDDYGGFGSNCDGNYNIDESYRATGNLEQLPTPWSTLFRGDSARIKNFVGPNPTQEQITNLGLNTLWGERPRECIVYRYNLPIRFNPNNNGTGAGRTLLNLEVEMICNHPDLSTIPHYNYREQNTNIGPKNYSSNTFKIQLDVPTNRVF